MQGRLGRWYESIERRTDLDVASAARTVSGASAAVVAEDIFAIAASLAISAASGTTPTLDVRLETTADGGATWYTCGTFAQTAIVASEAKMIAPVGSQVRWAWTIAGTTPSFTFAITCSANRDD
jgi:hypothetical protein